LLAGLADCGAAVTEPGGHPWRGCKITAITHTVRDDAEYTIGRLSDVTGPVEKAAAAFSELGFAVEPITLPEWKAAETDARRVLAEQPFDPEWFQGDARHRAEAIVTVEQAARTIQQLETQLPEFNLDAVRASAKAGALAGLNPDRERVAAANTITSRVRLATLNRIEASLRSLAQTASELHNTARIVAGMLQINRTPTADRLPELAEVATLIADGPPIPLDWRDAEERAELLEAFTLAAAEEKTVNAGRGELAARFQDEALAPESLMFVVEANEQSKSFVARLFPRWWRIKRQILAWYHSGRPGRAGLSADLKELELFHRRAAPGPPINAE
jgi:hypothetical protein